MIITNTRNKSCFFEELHYGEVFTFDGLYYMKVIEDSDINAVDLDSGELCYFREGDVVIPVEAELIIS